MSIEHLGDRLGRLRRAASLTQEQLAERAGLSVDVVRKLEQRRKTGARLDTLDRLASALGVEVGDLMATSRPAPTPARSVAGPRPTMPTALAGSVVEDLVRALIRITADDAASSDELDAAAPMRVLLRLPTDELRLGPELPDVGELRTDQPTIADVAILEDTTAAFRTWDHQHGGRLHRRAAVGQLAQVGGLLAVSQPRVVARRLFSVASRLALIVAQMTADIGMPRRARAYRLLAVEAAKVSGDATRLARAVNAEARAAMTARQPERALRLLADTRAAVGGDLTAETLALLATTDAWAYARMRQPDRVAGALDKGRLYLDGALPAPGSVFGVAELEGVAGACYEHLAWADPGRTGHAGRAEAHICAALQLRGGTYARSRVFDLAGLAHVHLLQAEPEQAARVGRQAVEAAAGVHSLRVRKRLHRTAVRSLSLFPDVPEVREFTEVVRTRLPAPSL